MSAYWKVASLYRATGKGFTMDQKFGEEMDQIKNFMGEETYSKMSIKRGFRDAIKDLGKDSGDYTDTIVLFKRILKEFNAIFERALEKNYIYEVSEPFDLENLPDDMIREVILQVPTVDDVLKLCKINHKFQKICSNNALWEKIFKKHFPHAKRSAPATNWEKEVRNLLLIQENVDEVFEAIQKKYPNAGLVNSFIFDDIPIADIEIYDENSDQVEKTINTLLSHKNIVFGDNTFYVPTFPFVFQFQPKGLESKHFT